jgi:predicted nucleotidyltransferase
VILTCLERLEELARLLIALRIQEVEMFGHPFRVIALEKLIAAKRAAGRTKDLLALPELEAILEYRRITENSAPETDEKNSYPG